MAYPGVSRATKSRMLMARRAGSSPPCRGREEGEGVLQAGGGREDSTYPSGVRGEEIGAQPTLCDIQPDTVRGEGGPASNPPLTCTMAKRFCSCGRECAAMQRSIQRVVRCVASSKRAGSCRVEEGFRARVQVNL